MAHLDTQANRHPIRIHREKVMNHKAVKKFFGLITLAAFLLGACSNKDVSENIPETPTMPNPQVRVELLPTLTMAPTVENLAPTAEPTLTQEVQIWFDPTPDVDALANQIESALDEIQRGLNNQNFNLK